MTSVVGGVVGGDCCAGAAVIFLPGVLALIIAPVQLIPRIPPAPF